MERSGIAGHLWQVPIAAELHDYIEVKHEEMYVEPFAVPERHEAVFISWFRVGEVFRSGLKWRRGAGNVFYFRPGHEAYDIFREPNMQAVIRNAVRWASSPVPRWTNVDETPNVRVDIIPERIEAQSPKLHADDEEAFAGPRPSGDDRRRIGRIHQGRPPHCGTVR